MTYDEAEEKSLNMNWVMDTCSQGEECWCRVIKPVKTIMYTNNGYDGSDYEEEYWIVRPGELNKKVAERIIEDHNVIVAVKEAMDVAQWESGRIQEKLEELM